MRSARDSVADAEASWVGRGLQSKAGHSRAAKLLCGSYVFFFDGRNRESICGGMLLTMWTCMGRRSWRSDCLGLAEHFALGGAP